MKTFLKKFGIACGLSFLFAGIAFASTLVVPQGGTGATAHVANGIIYSGTATNSPYISDIDATRDPINHDTAISKDDGTYKNTLLAGDTGGTDAAAISRFANVGTLNSIWAAVDGTGFARDASTILGLTTDTTGNISTTVLMDSFGDMFVHDDITSNTASLTLDANAGAFLNFNDANSNNTFDNGFFIDVAGIGWKDYLNSQTFYLPIVDGGAGDALVTDGAGNLSFTPIVGGIAMGAPVSGCGPKEFIYTSTTNTVACDPNAYRSDLTEDTALLNNVMETGFLSGIIMDDTVLPNSLAVIYFDAVANKGSFMRFQNNHMTNLLRDSSVVGTNLLGGLDVSYTNFGSPFISNYIQDSGTANVRSEFMGDLSNALMQFQYNLSGSLENTVTIDANSVYVDSDVNGANGQYLSLDFTNQLYAFGDLNNQNNSMMVYANDQFRSAGIGAFSGGSNNTNLTVDDSNQAIQGKTTADDLFYVDATGTSKVTYGYQAGSSITSATAVTFIGFRAGALATSSNDSVAVGNTALEQETDGVSNTAVGTAAMNATSGADQNVAIGRQAGQILDDLGLGSGHATRNVLLGSFSGDSLTDGVDNTMIGDGTDASSPTSIGAIALGRNAITTANYQFMVGGTGNPINTMVIAGDTAAFPTDVLFRINDGVGTNIAGADLTIQPGLATGNAATGNVIFKSALAGGSGTTLQTASTWGLIEPQRIRFGDIGGVGQNTLLDVNDTSGNGYIQLSAENQIQFNSNSDGIFLNGGQRTKRTAVNDADYTILPNDYLVSMENLSASRTVTVPDASSAFAGTVNIIKDADCLANTFNIVLDPAGTDTIDNASTFTMNVNCQAITIVSDGGTNWEII